MKKKETEEVETPPHPYSSLDLEGMRDVISSRDDASRARISHKASQIRDIALSDEESRIALYLVLHEGGV